MGIRHKYLSAVAILLLGLVYFSDTCVAQRIPNQSILFSNENKTGIIFGTVRFTNPEAKYSGYFPWIACTSGTSREAKENSTAIPITLSGTKHEGELDGGQTYLFMIEELPGGYTIPSVRMSRIKKNGTSSDVFITGFNIPFGVHQGEILYVGEIVINDDAGKKETIITLNDAFDKTIQALKKQQPLIDWNSAVKSELKIIKE